MPVSPVEIASDVRALEARMVATRRDLHAHPELAFEETRTAGIIADALKGLDLDVRTGMGKTGVVADVKGARPGKTILARFDMDALPIHEVTDKPYKSKNAGKMHACGHDGHVAIGLAVAQVLAQRREALAGVVRFMFQPAEEVIGGAPAMIADGLLDLRPRAVASYALHLWNEKPVGWVGATDGPSMAAADAFTVTITGKGGHAALPHQSRDAVVAAAQIVTALQSVVSRNVEPLEAAVVSVTMIRGGDTHNVLPPGVTLTGSIRSFNPAVRERVHRRVREIATGIASAMGCEATFAVDFSTPAVVNDVTIAKRVRDVARGIAGVESVHADERVMGSEDMAFVLEKVPGCYLRIGAKLESLGSEGGHHHPKFDFDERALAIGASVMAAVLADATEG